MINILKQIVNHTCQDFHLLEGGTLILYIGEVISSKPFRTAYRLWIDCSWRLQNYEKLLIGSLNDSELILDTIQIIVGKKIKKVDVNSFGDLSIEFEGPYHLKTFSYSTQDDIWELRRADGYRFGISSELKQYEKFEQPDELF
ncbi:hypothetical protein DENIS_0917 [Desulfonema ishimotonii]|uniref:Uncharacterized protein n=1 Tax=Desulfonema ishimotonii TaxID=45657 RepID=A0A401FSP1_9BACT|nr:hypothetical protein [Desulfonema ishimotonii]GBC59959.1 hypothetical protein DENIS_0901 [Desulfonema ishimotonii]GBC59975.1 hypothetical protein DENIS_0917 [Desulfonema ishimotonii]